MIYRSEKEKVNTDKSKEINYVSIIVFALLPATFPVLFSKKPPTELIKSFGGWCESDSNDDDLKQSPVNNEHIEQKSLNHHHLYVLLVLNLINHV